MSEVGGESQQQQQLASSPRRPEPLVRPASEPAMMMSSTGGTSTGGTGGSLRQQTGDAEDEAPMLRRQQSRSLRTQSQIRVNALSGISRRLWSCVCDSACCRLSLGCFGILFFISFVLAVTVVPTVAAVSRISARCDQPLAEYILFGIFNQYVYKSLRNASNGPNAPTWSKPIVSVFILFYALGYFVLGYHLISQSSMETCDKFLYWATDMMITFQLVGLCFALPLFLLIIAMLICFLPHMRNSPVPQLNDDDLDKKMERVITTKFSPGDIHAEDAECAICLTSYNTGDEVSTLPCDHHFHSACVGKWLRTLTATCPICRKCPTIVEGEENV